MVSALFCGTLGWLSGLWIATQKLGLTTEDALQMLAAASVAGFTAVVTLTNIQWIPWVKRIFLTNISKTWVVFLSLFSAITYGLSPRGLSWQAYGWMAFPLVLSTGFIIILFGPIQDRIVRHRQRKERQRSKAKA
jgi:magnesium-transporting ATPase (P-type)